MARYAWHTHTHVHTHLHTNRCQPCKAKPTRRDGWGEGLGVLLNNTSEFKPWEDGCWTSNPPFARPPSLPPTPLPLHGRHFSHSQHSKARKVLLAGSAGSRVMTYSSPARTGLWGAELGWINTGLVTVYLQVVACKRIAWQPQFGQQVQLCLPARSTNRIPATCDHWSDRYKSLWSQCLKSPGSKALGGISNWLTNRVS